MGDRFAPGQRVLITDGELKGQRATILGPGIAKFGALQTWHLRAAGKLWTSHVREDFLELLPEGEP